MFTQILNLNGQTFISSVQRTQVFNELQKPTGLSFYCSMHHSLWMQAIIKDENSRVLTLPCEQCKRTFLQPWPGSLWLDWDKQWNMRIPNELLKREFLLHFNILQELINESGSN